MFKLDDVLNLMTLGCRIERKPGEDLARLSLTASAGLVPDLPAVGRLAVIAGTND